MTVPLSGEPTLAAFGSSLTAITLAELGDKTFFMALILAVRHRARWVFVGAFAALTAVTLISLGLGYGLRELLPQAVVPWLAAVLFLVVGVELLAAAQGMTADAARGEVGGGGAVGQRACTCQISRSAAGRGIWSRKYGLTPGIFRKASAGKATGPTSASTRLHLRSFIS